MGAKFDRTVTLGRQDLFLTPLQIRNVCSAFGLSIDEQEAKQIALGKDRFCEPMLERLGAVVVDSVDANAFEGANIIHDLNQPMPAELQGRYDVVFDGGTLEHVFNFPSAMRGCLELPKVGGHFIMTSPANNQMGHGFYQFSPELFFRVFSAENGYQLKALLLAPTFSEGGWFKIRDPATVGARVGYNAAVTQLSIFAIAQRTRLVPLFLRPPQQSDYRAEWSNLPEKVEDANRLAFFDAAVARPAGRNGKVKNAIRELAPQGVLLWWRALRMARHCQQPPNPAHFEPFPIP
ncbi:MAG: hypothetical protein ACLPTZ_03310 [Beijerinckiaceae bacterium]